MTRQQALPILLNDDGSAQTLASLSLGAGPDQISEADLQALIHESPGCLPIAEIDPSFVDAVPICRELATPAGYIDNLLVTPTGLPVLVECKLWRNPQARREVVGQIVDYAKELSRWTVADLQREVSRSTDRPGNVIFDILSQAGIELDEIALNDALTFNLRRGRFLLLIVGDGIRESVEQIAEYIQGHSGLHFSIGLVELPIFVLPAGGRLIIPRTLCRTALINRSVISLPDGFAAQDDGEAAADEDDPAGRVPFWRDFAHGLVLDDPEQPLPRPGRQGYVTMPMPAPGGVMWLVIYRSEPTWEVGVYLSFNREGIGARINELLVEDWAAIKEELTGGARVEVERSGGRLLIQDSIRTGPWSVSEERMKAFEWLRQRTNEFVNVLRPRIRAIASDLGHD